MAAELEDLHLADLHQRAATAGMSGYRKLDRDALIEALAEAPESEEVVVEATVLDDKAPEPVELGSEGAEGGDAKGEALPTEEVRGVLELTGQRHGFLRLAGLGPSDGDVYISAAQVRRCELRPGDEVIGPAREPRRGERHRALVHVDRVNGEEPLAGERPEFDALAPIAPERRLALDPDPSDVLTRAVDLFSPFAFGQRALIRAAARSGRTTLLRSLTRAAATDENVQVIVLLIDARPEEATAWREAVPVAEFAIATAELASVEQVRLAELALERARRLAESGTDAVLACDSLSRLAFAAGNVDEVKRLFGSGRNLAGGGSLTVVATVLADGTDEGEAERAVLTTENSLITLDPELAAAGVYPAIRPAECRISNEDELREPAELEAVRRLRAQLADLRPTDAAALLRERIETILSNAELLASL
ncbi:MAG: transcription termination factor Rho [Solirubrobacterales bacterium]|jgi:transcription termination factor Rho|nr:transcription termination factor Rho [Solirubrobacterales bacterium]